MDRPSTPVGSECCEACGRKSNEIPKDELGLHVHRPGIVSSVVGTVWHIVKQHIPKAFTSEESSTTTFANMSERIGRPQTPAKSDRASTVKLSPGYLRSTPSPAASPSPRHLTSPLRKKLSMASLKGSLRGRLQMTPSRPSMGSYTQSRVARTGLLTLLDSVNRTDDKDDDSLYDSPVIRTSSPIPIPAPLPAVHNIGDFCSAVMTEVQRIDVAEQNIDPLRLAQQVNLDGTDSPPTWADIDLPLHAPSSSSMLDRPRPRRKLSINPQSSEKSTKTYSLMPNDTSPTRGPSRIRRMCLRTPDRKALMDVDLSVPESPLSRQSSPVDPEWGNVWQEPDLSVVDRKLESSMRGMRDSRAKFFSPRIPPTRGNLKHVFVNHID